jgi:hypothetical protein
MTPNRWLALLITVATVLFAIGVSIEKPDAHTESAEVAHAEGEAAEGETAAAEDGDGEEALLGIDLESTPLVVLAVIASFALAAGAWARSDSHAVLTLIGVAMLAFAVLDIREPIHQLDEDESGLALLAALVAALHLAAGGLAWRLESSAEAARA